MEISSPLHIHWEVTNECNYNCRHCYQQNDGRKFTLPQNNILSIAKKIVEANVFQVSISGGEPFLVSNILDILEFFHKSNTEIIVCSNGSQINKKHIAVLSRLSIPVQISLDSYIEEKHNEFRRSIHAFSDAINAVKNLLENGINVSVAFCATQYNFMDFEGIVDLCIDLGVKHLVVGEMIPVRGGDCANVEFLFTKDAYMSFTELLKQKVEQNKNDISIHVNSEWGFVFSDFYDHAPCTALERDFAILHNGFVTPCPFVRNPAYYLGNVLETDIIDIWKNAKSSEFYLKKNQGCNESCRFYSLCLSGCKAQLANQNSDISRRDIRCPI